MYNFLSLSHRCYILPCQIPRIYNGAWPKAEDKHIWFVDYMKNAPKSLFYTQGPPSTSLHSSCVFLSNPQMQAPDIPSPIPLRLASCTGSGSASSIACCSIWRGRNTIHREELQWGETSVLHTSSPWHFTPLPYLILSWVGIEIAISSLSPPDQHNHSREVTGQADKGCFLLSWYLKDTRTDTIKNFFSSFTIITLCLLLYPSSPLPHVPWWVYQNGKYKAMPLGADSVKKQKHREKQCYLEND